MTSNPQAEHRRRLRLLQQQLASGKARASVARAALEGGTVTPRPRHQLLAELRTWTDLDEPMLRAEIARVEASLAEQERAQQTEPPPLAVLIPRGDPTSPLEVKRRELGEMLHQRDAAVSRITVLRRAVDIVVGAMMDHGNERRRLREAIDSLVEIDRQIDEAGTEVKALDGLPISSASISRANEGP